MTIFPLKTLCHIFLESSCKILFTADDPIHNDLHQEAQDDQKLVHGGSQFAVWILNAMIPIIILIVYIKFYINFFSSQGPACLCVIYFWKVYLKSSSMVMTPPIMITIRMLRMFRNVCHIIECPYFSTSDPVSYSYIYF